MPKNPSEGRGVRGDRSRRDGDGWSTLSLPGWDSCSSERVTPSRGVPRVSHVAGAAPVPCHRRTQHFADDFPNPCRTCRQLLLRGFALLFGIKSFLHFTLVFSLFISLFSFCFSERFPLCGWWCPRGPSAKNHRTRRVGRRARRYTALLG